MQLRSTNRRDSYTISKSRQQRSKSRPVWVLLFVVMIAAIIGLSLYEPRTNIAPSLVNSQAIPNSPTDIDWPSRSQSAIGDLDSGVMASSPDSTPRPTASLAKLITMLVVLDHKPLQPGEQGPLITMTEDDVKRYNDYYAVNGTVTKIEAGQQIAQYDLLAGTMLVSSNNYSDSLALWAFGSFDGYRSAAADYLAKIGANDTKVGSDASGLAPDTISTPRDLVLLGIETYKHPVLRQIMTLPTVDLPLNPPLRSHNFMLGRSGIVGGKTGNTDEAGGVFVSMAKTVVNDQEKILVVAVQGEPTWRDAVNQAVRLTEQTLPLYQKTDMYKKGDRVARYESDWGEEYHALAAEDISFVGWNAIRPDVRLEAKSLTNKTRQNDNLGELKVNGQSFQLVADQDINKPNFIQKLKSLFASD